MHAVRTLLIALAAALLPWSGEARAQAVAIERVDATPEGLRPGQRASVTARIERRDRGLPAVLPVVVRFAVAGAARPFATQRLALRPGEEQTVRVQWPASAGRHTIVVTLDAPGMTATRREIVVAVSGEQAPRTAAAPASAAAAAPPAAIGRPALAAAPREPRVVTTERVTLTVGGLPPPRFVNTERITLTVGGPTPPRIVNTDAMSMTIRPPRAARPGLPDAMQAAPRTGN
ncbi:MAG: hypothetical protein JNL66_01255 [Alphaproteobacteria bacterium]|nr:hypothetical protein [Alphaproteobacteria bacterium]